MSESKYSPEVNMPSQVPGRIESMSVMFLQPSTGQYVAVGAEEILLRQVKENQIALSIKLENGRMGDFLYFPGTLTVEEKPLVEVVG